MKLSLTLLAFLFLIVHGNAQTATSSRYTEKCQVCHGVTGRADTPAGKAMGARAFNSPDVIKQSDADLLEVIKNGKGKMPAFAGKLTEPQMVVLVAYIRKLQ
ncbi:MAG TPA: cytochrome c [Terracidiphilus sp.]|jgi:mono/diheme cytochrome c family protein|nr:cytochrome c [Terracidiphilus sp.]